MVGRHGDELKVRLAAPPVDGAANDALVRWLAEVLDLPRAAVTLSAGHSSRSKVVAITGITATDARARLGLDRDEPPLHRSPPAR